MVFRVNFLTFWIVMNTLYAVVVENYASLTSNTDTDDTDIQSNNNKGFLAVFAMYLAALVAYKVFFGAQHILKFKFLSNFV